jgi:membrane protein
MTGPGVIRHIGFFFSLGPRRVGKLFQETLAEWNKDDVSRLSAALAYYTIFSMAPLFMVVIAVAGMVFGDMAVRGQIVWQVEYLIGMKAAEGVQAMLEAAAPKAQGLTATIAGLLTLFFGASLVIAELRHSLNVIWKVPAPTGAQGMLADLLSLLQQRLVAFLLVLGIGFLQVVSLLMNAAIAALGKYLQYVLPVRESVLQAISFALWFGVTTLVFALIYKVLPDIEIAWSDVVVGAAMTSLLFTAGKLLISLYLGKTGLASAYGAAGSIVIIPAWVYYSAQVFFFGAEFTRVYANRYGSHLVARSRPWWAAKAVASQ